MYEREILHPTFSTENLIIIFYIYFFLFFEKPKDLIFVYTYKYVGCSIKTCIKNLPANQNAIIAT